ncbi:MAG: AMP-binding protein [Acidimicrobiales bacterium]
MNLASIIDPHPADDVALVTNGAEVTYGELRERVGALRGSLVSAGLRPGDRVAVVCANNRSFVESYLAVIGAGLVAVPLNPQSPVPELTKELAAVGARALVAGPLAGSTVARIDRGAVASLELVIAARPDDVPGSVGLDAALEADPVPIVERRADDPVVLMFTSGTAGAPRAAVLTHGNLMANMDQVQAVPEIARASDDVTYGVLPLFHIFGLNVVLNPALLVGATIVLAERFDPLAAADAVRAHGVTTLTGPPTMWAVFAQTAGIDADTFASVRLAVSGASKLPVEVGEQVEARFGLRLYEGYGLTETSPVAAYSVGTGAPHGSIGRPLPGVEMRLVDPTGDDVLVGDAGEILLRGPNVFGGYWEDPEATAAVLDPDGWLHTGDVAVVDDDGYLFIVDRAKDLIVVSGFNVYPAEVEEVLLEHPNVLEAGVVGGEHPTTGETVRASVVVRPGAVCEEDEIIAFVGERLARYKCPTSVQFVDEIPRGLGGKILRRTLA